MKMREKYKDEIVHKAKTGSFWDGIMEKYVFPFYGIKNISAICASGRVALFLLWLDEEYAELEKKLEVNWNKIEVDTPILVNCNQAKWRRAYFAKYEDGVVYAWLNGRTSWTESRTEPWEFAILADDHKIDEGAKWSPAPY